MPSRSMSEVRASRTAAAQPWWAMMNSLARPHYHAWCSVGRARRLTDHQEASYFLPLPDPEVR